MFAVIIGIIFCAGIFVLGIVIIVDYINSNRKE